VSAYLTPITDSTTGAVHELNANVPTLILAALPVGLGLIAFRFGWRFLRSQVR